MISYQMNSKRTVYYVQGDIKELDVDCIICFLDGPNLKNVGTRNKTKLNNFNSVNIREGENLKSKYIMYTSNLSDRPDNMGYQEGIKCKINCVLEKAKEENYQSLALPVICQYNIQDLILKTYHEYFSKAQIPHGKIYLVCDDEMLFEKIKQKFSSQLTKSEIFTSNSKMPNASGRIEIEEDTVTPDTTDSTDQCTICLCDITQRKTLDKCGHSFCSYCIDQSFAQSGHFCPICQTIYGQITGLQPPGRMTVHKTRDSLPGFSGCGMYQLSYDIPSGIQQKHHPNPGTWFSGTQRLAYLPANEEGETVLKMLQKAFQQKLIFTVGFSRTNNCDNVVTWNDIHHKTSPYGGAMNFGYPDKDYLKRVTLELEAKGLDAKSVENESIRFSLESN